MIKKSIKPLLCCGLFIVLSLPHLSCRSPGSNSATLGEVDGTRANEGAPQIVRFTVLLDKLDKEMKGLAPKDAADRLVAGNARETAFSLQALGRIYESLDPQFSVIRKKFKRLEDGIGDYAKWVELLGKGQINNASAAVLEKLQKKRDAALIEMEKMLKDSEFVPADTAEIAYIQSLRNFLTAYKWRDAATDRQDMLAYLRNELEMIKTTRYDFSHLENGEGVHEFRRKMRWIPMEAKALNGMVTLKPTSVGCPIPIYASVVKDGVAKSKYGVLPSSANELNSITLTPCLYVQIAKLVDVVGAIKGDIEEEDNNTTAGAALDSVKPADQAAVQKILDDTLSTNLFGLLQAELVQAPTNAK